MKPVPPDPAELVHRMRQQLILVQVRIMELEDARDEMGNRLADCQQMLRAAQVLADQKLDESSHLERVRAELLARFEHLQHVHHLTNEALTTSRAELARFQQSTASLEIRAAQLTATLEHLEASQRDLVAQLRECTAASAARQQRIMELDAEVRALRTSRSWRWTAWLRSLERLFSRGKS